MAEQPQAGQEVEEEGKEHGRAQAQARDVENAFHRGELGHFERAQRGHEGHHHPAEEPQAQVTFLQLAAAEGDRSVVGLRFLFGRRQRVELYLLSADVHLGKDAADGHGHVPGDQRDKRRREEAAGHKETHRRGQIEAHLLRRWEAVAEQRPTDDAR